MYPCGYLGLKLDVQRIHRLEGTLVSTVQDMAEAVSLDCN